MYKFRKYKLRGRIGWPALLAELHRSDSNVLHYSNEKYSLSTPFNTLIDRYLQLSTAYAWGKEAAEAGAAGTEVTMLPTGTQPIIPIYTSPSSGLITTLLTV